MTHDTRKMNNFVRHVESCRLDMPYNAILNSWLARGNRVADPEELNYLIGLIPMAQKRRRAWEAYLGAA